MDRNIRRRLGVFASSSVLATSLVLAAGGTAFAANGGPGGSGGNGGNGGNTIVGNGGHGGNGGAGGNGGDSWTGGASCSFCNHPVDVRRCLPVATWCGAPRGWDLAGWLGCPVFSPQLLNRLLNHATNCPFRCSA